MVVISEPHKELVGGGENAKYILGEWAYGLWHGTVLCQCTLHIVSQPRVLIV